MKHWVCYNPSTGGIVHTRSAYEGVSSLYCPPGLVPLEYSPRHHPPTRELMVDVVTGRLVPRPEFEETVEIAEVAGTWTVRITCGVAPVTVYLPDGAVIDDDDGVIEWETENAGTYSFALESPVRRRIELDVEVG